MFYQITIGHFGFYNGYDTANAEELFFRWLRRFEEQQGPAALSLLVGARVTNHYGELCFVVSADDLRRR